MRLQISPKIRLFLPTTLCRALAMGVAAAALIAPFPAAAQETFDFGDGHHGSRILGPGETSVTTLYSQVRTAADRPSYDPSFDNAILNFENLTLSSGAVLTVPPFSGNPRNPINPAEGGYLRIRVSGALLLQSGARIDATARGYQGGSVEGGAPGYLGEQGDSWGVAGTINTASARGGGGGGLGELPDQGNPGSGGGGGHMEAGQPGMAGDAQPLGGRGGMSFDEAAITGALSDYPFPRFGSGGGRGGQTEDFASINSFGGRGGGIIVIEAREIINLGTIRADGGTGGTDLSGGGGGAGGSILIRSLSPENGTTTANGGQGGASRINENTGGAGGAGLVVWDARYTLEVLIEGEGTVSRSPDSPQYVPNSTVSLTPVAATGWQFDHWEGDLTGDLTPGTLSMTASRSVTAVFVEEPELIVQPANQTVSAGGGNVSFQVSNTGTESLSWVASIASGADFMSIVTGTSGTRGESITVQVSANATASERVGQIRVESFGAQGDPILVTVTQPAAIPVLDVTPDSQNVAAAGGDATFTIRNAGTGSMPWVASVREGQDFATITSPASGTDDGTLVVTASENTSLLTRMARIRIQANNAAGSPVEVVVVQPPRLPMLRVTPENQSVGAAAGTVSFVVDNGGSGTLNWTASVIGGVNFVNIVSGTSGQNSGEITVQVAEYNGTADRIGTIRIEAPGAIDSPKFVTVTQSSRDAVLRVSPERQTVGFAGGAVSLTVENSGSGNLNWTASVASGADFLSVNAPGNGINGGQVSVTVTPNARPLARSGSIRVEAAGAEGSPFTVSITQNACELPDRPTNVNASDGTFADRVNLIWSAVPGATSYEIFRANLNLPTQAELIGFSAVPEYVDQSALPPEVQVVYPGCLEPGRLDVELFVHFYWIKAVTSCGPSVFSAVSTGYVGREEDLPTAAKGLLIEDALPHPATAHLVPGIATDSVLAIQLYHPDGVDSASAWGEIRTALGGDADLWTLQTPTTAGPSTWVQAIPLGGWTPGDTITFTAGGTALSGAPLESVTRIFHVSAAKALQAEGLGALEGAASYASFQGAVGEAMQVGPETIFEGPQQIWLPVPEGFTPDELAVYYASPDAAGGLWYPAQNVVGWLANESLVLRTGEYGTEIGITVNHGGIVQLGLRADAAPPATTGAAMLPISRQGGELVALAFAVAVMALAGLRRRKA